MKKITKKVALILSAICLFTMAQVPSMEVHATDLGFHFCDDAITVDYDDPTSKPTNDQITICLKVKEDTGRTDYHGYVDRLTGSYTFAGGDGVVSADMSTAYVDNYDSLAGVKVKVNVLNDGEGTIKLLKDGAEVDSLTITVKNKSKVPPTPTPTPSPSPSDDQAASTVASVPHTHNFTWVTTKEATIKEDGLEELKCDCGMVEEQNVVPSCIVYVKGLCSAIDKVPTNGEVSFDSGTYCTVSDYLVKKLQARSDVKVNITFENKQGKYKMIIPAGVDYSKLLEDDCSFYGFFGFAKEIGATIERL